MQNDSVVSILEEIKGARSIAFTGHMRPDGDCYGSVLGLYTYIKENKDIFNNLEVADIFLWKNDLVDEFQSGGLVKIASLTNVHSYDLLIACDSSSTDRIDAWDLLKSHSSRVIVIDHHITNLGYGDLNYIKDVSSTCEVLFDFIDLDRISAEVAKCLYFGILTDTGGFRFSMTKRKTMELAGFCIERGNLDTESIMGRAFDEKTPEFYRLLGIALLMTEYYKLSNIQSLSSWNLSIAYVFLDKKTLYKLGYTKPEKARIENIPAMLKSTNGCIASVTVTELSNSNLRVSLRCNNKLDVAVIASQYQGGGGHKTAAGLDIRLESNKSKHEQVVKFVEIVAKELANQINTQGLTLRDFS